MTGVHSPDVVDVVPEALEPLESVPDPDRDMSFRIATDVAHYAIGKDAPRNDLEFPPVPFGFELPGC